MKTAVWVAAGLGLAACLFAKNASFTALVNKQWQYRLQTDPEMATHAGDYRYNDKLRDRSAAEYLREIEHARQTLKRFEAVKKDQLSPDEKVTLALLIGNLRNTIE